MQLFLFNIANSFVNLTLATDPRWKYTLDGKEIDLTIEHPWLQSVMTPILNLLNTLLLPLLIIIGTVGSIYAIVLGVNFSRAETSEKREEAKKRMINAIVGLVAMVFLLIVLQLLVANAPDIVKTITGYGSAQKA